MFQFAGFASHAYIFSVGYSLRSGFPHSDISGSKLHCQLPRAFRRLVRPSSPVIAKASTTCTYSLDPITLSSLPRPQATGNSCVLPLAGDRCNHNRITNTPTGAPAIQPSSSFLKSTHPVKGQACRVDHYPAGLTVHSARMVEDDGIEPTTPCLQSRCSPS